MVPAHKMFATALMTGKSELLNAEDVGAFARLYASTEDAMSAAAAKGWTSVALSYFGKHGAEVERIMLALGLAGYDTKYRRPLPGEDNVIELVVYWRGVLKHYASARDSYDVIPVHVNDRVPVAARWAGTRAVPAEKVAQVNVDAAVVTEGKPGPSYEGFSRRWKCSTLKVEVTGLDQALNDDPKATVIRRHEYRTYHLKDGQKPDKSLVPIDIADAVVATIQARDFFELQANFVSATNCIVVAIGFYIPRGVVG